MSTRKCQRLIRPEPPCAIAGGSSLRTLQYRAVLQWSRRARSPKALAPPHAPRSGGRLCGGPSPQVRAACDHRARDGARRRLGRRASQPGALHSRCKGTARVLTPGLEALRLTPNGRPTPYGLTWEYSQGRWWRGAVRRVCLGLATACGHGPPRRSSPRVDPTDDQSILPHTPSAESRAGGRAESRSRGLSDRSWQGWGVRRSREGFLRAVMDEAAAPSDGLDGAAHAGPVPLRRSAYARVDALTDAVTLRAREGPLRARATISTRSTLSSP